MAFVDKRLMLAATLAVLTTAALLLAGNGMNSLLALDVGSIHPRAAARRRDHLVARRGRSCGTLRASGQSHPAVLHPFRAACLCDGMAVPISIAALLFAAGVLLFRGLLHRGAAFSAMVALPACWTVCEFLGSFSPANGTAGSLAYTQERFLPMLQVASLTGPWGLSAVVVSVGNCQRIVPPA